jgi:hypothetical protein
MQIRANRFRFVHWSTQTIEGGLSWLALQTPSQATEEDNMDKKFWQAFYFKNDDPASPPERTEVIETECGDDAVKIASAHLERCQRVDLEGPRWERRDVRTVVADGHAPSAVRTASENAGTQ